MLYNVDAVALKDNLPNLIVAARDNALSNVASAAHISANIESGTRLEWDGNRFKNYRDWSGRPYDTTRTTDTFLHVAAAVKLSNKVGIFDRF